MGLAQDLKEGTKQSHSAAENTKFVSSFLRGVVNKEKYRQLVANYYFIYQALEVEVLRLKDDPIVGPLNMKELYRQRGLSKDCEYFFGNDWRNTIYPSEACQQYVNRIREVAHDDTELLVGHHYTRYLGDLSGGQILRNIAKNSLKLNDGGLDFYEFPDIENKKEFKNNYRATLNKLPVTSSQVSAIVSEANYAFRLNMFMFEELDGNALKSTLAYICGIIKGKN
tara:strand:- start:2660 stop:3334 length:675 start_codon:yes stop_codon:yes gene_type:complete